MQVNRGLILALGILAGSPAAHAVTVQFSGYVNSIEAVKMSSDLVQTGMLINGTFEYDVLVPATYNFAGSYEETSYYSTGIVTLTIGNGLWFSTVPIGSSYALIQRTMVTNSSSGAINEEIAFASLGFGAFDTNFATPAGGNSFYPDTGLVLEFINSDRTALNNSSLPLAALLTGGAFDKKTLSISYDASVGVPCSSDPDQMCTDVATYTINSIITSVSEVPLPPSLFLTGSSLSLLLLGKAARGKKQKQLKIGG